VECGWERCGRGAAPREYEDNAVGFFEIYKRGQGKYTRIVTFVGAMVIGLFGASSLSETLSTHAPYIHFGVPFAVLLGLAILMFWLVNRPKNVDFLVATEGEMKKVSWSNKKEIIGSTKVVIITTFVMAFMLYGVDYIFGSLFMYVIPIAGN
jgi:preprotein translocase SecE subunit